MLRRPLGTASLFDNTTLTGQWIHVEDSDPAASFAQYQRIINNATMAMPHPGTPPCVCSVMGGRL